MLRRLISNRKSWSGAQRWLSQTKDKGPNPIEPAQGTVPEENSLVGQKKIWPIPGNYVTCNEFKLQDQLLDQAGISDITKKVIGPEYCAQRTFTYMEYRKAIDQFKDPETFRDHTLKCHIAGLTVRIKHLEKLVTHRRYRKWDKGKLRMLLMMHLRNRMLKALRKISLEDYKLVTKTLGFREMLSHTWLGNPEKLIKTKERYPQVEFEPPMRRLRHQLWREEQKRKRRAVYGAPEVYW
eukprot:CAMPEP_0113954936 /NCGR_PEP_ID=MMETSP0011_2-20120614/959_1 /TAXON_ID=101924 /ORGANISM="Rhodosorus marinus" /LENGTH=237 /DNA_ID=CAMNT_0000964379 /DNA_START=353 /DNA_END=1063 /DNA_ORIENTATION=+ /assembly_acc=CAM_ASM_000156